MAPDLVARVRRKLTKRRHSFASSFSFVSSKSAASSLQDDQNETRPEQLSPASSTLHSAAGRPGSRINKRRSQQMGDPGPNTSPDASRSMPTPGASDLQQDPEDEQQKKDDRDAELLSAEQPSLSPATAAKLQGTDGAEQAKAADQLGDSATAGDAASSHSKSRSVSPTRSAHIPHQHQQQPQPEAQPAGGEHSSPPLAPPKNQHPSLPSPSSPLPSQLHSIDEAPSPPSSHSPPDRSVSRPRVQHFVPDGACDARTGSSSSSANDSGRGARGRDKTPDTLSLSLHDNNKPLLAIEPPSVETPASPSIRTQLPIRRQSLLSNRQSNLIHSLLGAYDSEDNGSGLPPLDIVAKMAQRKIWVKRPNASPTLVIVNEDDLVDDVRGAILQKYGNSLGRSFDAPDLTLRICPREQPQRERILGPEEHICRTLDTCFPDGQRVDEALIIDIPARRTPRPSPRIPNTYYINDDGRPSEAAEGYFPPVGGIPSPHHTVTVQPPTNGTVPHSIAVIGTGHIPPIPSPGGTRPRVVRERTNRPKITRTQTSSPSYVASHPVSNSVDNTNYGHGSQHYTSRPSHSRAHSNSSEYAKGLPPPTNPITSSPGPIVSHPRSSTPPPRLSSPRPNANRKKSRRTAEYPSAPTAINVGVPPINVLIVEDNPINLKLLEAFVKRLKVRWQTAMHGQEAVDKWRTGGFHLVLMDIQLPVMDGLDATREIRRLERVNNIGVFSSSDGLPEGLPEESDGELRDQDRLQNKELFKSPPVNFVWLERKVMEWGCMQALIDFDGWRKWKDFSQLNQESEASKKAAAAAKARAAKKKNRSSLSTYT
ncbi:unnamed protein product [Clonostachys rosea]|uniref:Response regulatory domain-containing protein n=1 Tax=Bionectria ochroleuca TaxID=29856 RepID=A0ABY6UV25_BIOOC|nr:unnamed protein product [Clonostachys rosea]